MRRGSNEEVIAQGRAGFSITADNQHFSIRAPLATTRVEWLAVDGPFVAGSDGTVRFRMKPEFLRRRNPLLRLSVRLGRSVMRFDGIRVDAADYGGTTAEALAADLNERLSGRVGPPSPGADQASGTRVQRATPGPLVRLVHRSFWVALAVIVLVFVGARLIH
jgi:hypothetical protein